MTRSYSPIANAKSTFRMNNFRELIVWKKSVDLVTKIYSITRNFPDSEKFNLTSQMQRSGTSIPSNIAEGAGRSSGPLFKQFLTIALGSAYELETQIIISNKLGFIDDDSCNVICRKVIEIQRMIFGLINTL